MTEKKFKTICGLAVEKVRSVAPVDTGNLKNNGIRYEFETPTRCVIYVDGDGKDGIAYYMPFTNEEWVSPRWNGKKNPNEGWWQNKALATVLDFLVNETGGKLK